MHRPTGTTDQWDRRGRRDRPNHFLTRLQCTDRRDRRGLNYLPDCKERRGNTLRGVVRGDWGRRDKRKKSMSQNWLKFCWKKVDMTSRTLPEGFCPKRGCCLATSKQKWRENENLRFSYYSIEIKVFLNNCVSDAVNWVPRPERHVPSISTLTFSWNVTVFAIESL